MSSFTYTPTAMTDIETLLSSDRFDTYMTAVGGDQRCAIKLYEWNTAISSTFYTPLQSVEIALRNACRPELTILFDEDWHSQPAFISLDRRFGRAIQEAKERISLLHLPTDTPHIVAELSFGFLTNLFSHRFDRVLWVPGLYRAFPRFRSVTGTALTRPLIAQRLHHLRKLRNRIAHHEPIFRRALEADYLSLLEIADTMYPSLRSWIQHLSMLEHIFLKKPFLPS